MINLKGRMIDGRLILEVQLDESLDPDGKPLHPPEDKIFLGVRCGLSWPIASNPGGYYCLVAQEAKRLITGEKPLFVIREFNALTLNALLEKMVNDMGIFGCFEIFTEMSKRYENYLNALSLFLRNNRSLQQIKVKPAPYAEGNEGFLHGKNMIDKWIKEIKFLTIPKGFCIHSELRVIREVDLKGNPQEKFFAINALRYVLGAFETSDIPQSTANRVAEKGLPPGAWN